MWVAHICPHKGLSKIAAGEQAEELGTKKENGGEKETPQNPLASKT